MPVWGIRTVNDAQNQKSTITAKTVRADTQAPMRKVSQGHRSYIRLMIAVALCVFVSEAIIMIVIHPWFHLSPWLIAFIDAFILIVFLSPALYVYVFRPMFRYIKEREQAMQALRESEIRFRTVFRTSPDSISISRLKDGRLVDVNEGFTLLSGYSREEVLGISSLDLPLWVNAGAREELLAGLQKDGRITNFETRFQHKDRRTLDALISARVILLQEEPHILAVGRDISEIKKIEKTLRVSRNFLRISNRHSNMDALLAEFIAEIKLLTDCSAMGLRILDGNGNIPYQASEGFRPEFYESENPRTIDSVRCMCSDVILGRIKIKPGSVTRGGSFYVGSTSRFIAKLSESERKQVCAVCSTYGYESVALIPIPLSDKILGLIHLADARKDFLSLETIEILEAAAMQLGIAIERVRAEEALQKSYREMERRVEERTAQLVSANELLNLEIEERKFNEGKLLEQQHKLRSLSSELLLTEERERRSIATELHDRIGQSLAVARIKLGEFQEALTSNPAEANAEALGEIRGYIEQTIEDTRSLTFELSPPVLYELGLAPAIAWLASQIEGKHGLQIQLQDDGETKPLDNGCRVVAFQAARELLFNIVKHARAKSAAISMKTDGEVVRIDIEDDGIGFDTAELDAAASGSDGFGLFSIRERFHTLGGRLEIHSEPGRGTRASLLLPLVCDTED
jgi:PAS domain S-box-containing protein